MKLRKSPLMIALKRVNYLVTDLTEVQNTYSENYKTFQKKMKKDLNK